MRHFTSGTLFASLLFMAGSASANWVLNPTESALFFATVKQGAITEIHHFGRMAGTVGDTGRARLDIDLASIDSHIAIRDERMREHLFQVNEFPLATVDIDLNSIKSGIQTVYARLNLHGVKTEITTQLNVSIDGNKLRVSSSSPLLIDASDYGLDTGIETLRELAGLDSIKPTVPVTFSLTFDKQ